MTIENRINGFVNLDQRLGNLRVEEKETLYHKALIENPWFTYQNIELALKGMEKFLQKDKLKAFVSKYKFKENSKKIGVAMAGNIPLVGFHDFLCVLLSGNQIILKPSSQDSV